MMTRDLLPVSTDRGDLVQLYLAAAQKMQLGKDFPMCPQFQLSHYIEQMYVLKLI
jgi:hypothetical protein